MRRILWAAVAALFVLPVHTFGQGVSFNDSALRPTATIAGASVRVCTEAAVGTPCTPLASIFSDKALTNAKTNPFAADSQGHIQFWAAPGNYKVQIAAAGFATKTFTITLGAATGGAGSVAAASDGIQYVSANGNDANDGLSIGSAKKTYLAAYNACKVNSPNGCRIEIFGDVNIAANGTDGLRICGPNDPACSPLPAGWVEQMRLTTMCMSPRSHEATAQAPKCRLIGGSTSDIALPSLWTAGINTPMHFIGVRFDGAMAYNGGQSPDGSIGEGNSTVTFDFVDFVTSFHANAGPTVRIFDESFWIRFRYCTFNANPNATPGSDARAAILIKGQGTKTPGLIEFVNTNINGGPIVVYGDAGLSTTGGLTLRLQGTTTFEGDLGVVAADGGAVWIRTPKGSTGVIAEDIVVADAPSGTLTVRVDDGAGAHDSHVIVWGVDATHVKGPALVLGSRADENWETQAKSPVYLRQGGFWQTPNSSITRQRILAQHDGARRLLGPVAVPYTNLAPQDASTWSAAPGGATVTTGKLFHPSGLNVAAELASASGNAPKEIYRVSRTVAVGDWFVGGAAARVANAANGPSSNTLSLTFAGDLGVTLLCSTGRTGNELFFTYPLKSDGEWQWVSFACRITATDASTKTVTFSLRTEATKPMEYAYPEFYHFGPGGVANISDNEVLEFAQHISGARDGAPIGSVALRRGQTFLADSATLGNLNNILFVDGVKYANSSTGLAAALADLPAAGGIVYVMTPFTFTTNPFAGVTKPFRVFFGPGTWSTDVGLTVPNNGQILAGAGVNATQIQTTASFPINTAIISIGKAGGVFGSWVEGMHVVDDNAISGTICLDLHGVQETSGVRFVAARTNGASGRAIRIRAANAGDTQNPLELTEIRPQTLHATGIPLLIESTVDVRVVIDGMSSNGAAVGAVAVQKETGAHVEFRNVHIEGVTTAFVNTAGAITIRNFVGHSTIQHIFTNTAAGGSYVLENVDPNGATGNTVNDTGNSITETGGIIHMVRAGAATKVVYGTMTGRGWLITSGADPILRLDAPAGDTMTEDALRITQSDGATIHGRIRKDGLFSGTIFDASTGFRLAGAATEGTILKGDGTNFVGLPRGTDGQCLLATPTTIAWGSCAGGGSNHNLLSATHPDTVAASPVLGDILFGNATPAWTKLAGNTTTTRQFLRQTGNGTVSAAPAWDTLLAGDIPSLDASKITTGQLLPARGGTGDDTSAITGVPRISAGNWLYDAGISHLAASTSAHLAGVLSDEGGTAGVFIRVSGTPEVGDGISFDGTDYVVSIPAIEVNAQVGTTYTFVAADRGKLVTFSNAGSVAVTLPQAGSAGFTSNFFAEALNRGAGAVTITPTTSTINGAASLVLSQGECALIRSDNTNYVALNVLRCDGTDAPGGTGDSITVDGVAATDPDFKTGTGDIDFALNTTPTPDEITATVVNNAITFAKMQDLAGFTLLGKPTTGTGDPAELAVGTNTVVGRVAGDVVAAQLATAQIGDNVVTVGKFQQIVSDRLLGRDTAATGNVEELTVSGGIEFTGAGGLQTSAFTGDVTKSAGGTAQTIAAQNSAFWAGKVTDETGTGPWVFGTDPTLSNPSLNQTALTVRIANAGTPGTTVNKLAKLTGAPSTAVITGATDTADAVGIVVSGAGTTGSAEIAWGGVASCVFDGATTAGNFVGLSGVNAGNCKDIGSAYPTNGIQVVGRALSTNGAGGTFAVYVFPADIRDSQGAGGSGDSITVEGVAATDPDFINQTATATAPATTWTLDTVPTPDTIKLTVGAASDTVAGILTANAQTLGGLKTFNGGVALLDGSVTAPSLSRSGDSDTGLYFTASGNKIRFTVDGADAFRLAAAGPTWVGTLGGGTSGSDLKSAESTSPVDFLQLLMAQPGTAGQRDSHTILLRGTSFDTAGHNADWKAFADVTSDAGVSTFRLQSRIDAAGFVSRLSVSDAGDVTFPGVLTAGSTPTTVTDAAGKVLSAALNTVAITEGGTGATTQTAAMDALSPTTTKGDLLVDNGTNVIRVPVGTNDQVLTADSAQASGVKWAAGGGAGGGVGTLDLTKFTFREDFVCRTQAGTTNNLHCIYNWGAIQIAGTNTWDRIAGESNAPGIGRITTGATVDNGLTTNAGGSVGQAVFAANAGWEAKIRVRVPDNTDIQMQVGFTNGDSFSPSQVAWAKFHSGTAANFIFGTRSTAAESTVNSTVNAGTGFHVIRIRSTTAGTILFSVDGETEVSQTAQIPTAALFPYFSCKTTAAAAKQCDIDLFFFEVTVTR